LGEAAVADSFLGVGVFLAAAGFLPPRPFLAAGFLVSSSPLASSPFSSPLFSTVSASGATAAAVAADFLPFLPGDFLAAAGFLVD